MIETRYRLAPFWFWNHQLEPAELEYQLHEMKEKGMGGLYIHARHGLQVPYMDSQWMECIKHCLDTARKLGLEVWLYDDCNWPSGTCDGRVIEENPDHRMSFLHLTTSFDLMGPITISQEIDTSDGLLWVLAVPLDPILESITCEGILDITTSVMDNRLCWQAPAGRWRVMVFARTFYRGYFGGGYVDTLNKAAIHRFIELTHKTYIEAFRPYVGDVIKGFFTDEPACNYSLDSFSLADSGLLRALPWTPTLPKEFKYQHHYPLKPYLPALFYNVGPQTAKIRCDFYSTVLSLYREAFFQQIRDVCKRHNLLSVGHVNAEGELFYQIFQQMDFFSITEEMDYAGYDHLFNQTWSENTRLDNLVGLKFASSAGHLLGKDRVLSEAFGVADGWKLNLATLKRLFDWQIALGANYFVPHAYYYSIEGFRKWEATPSHSHHSTFWSNYQTFADYAARMCQRFSGGRHVADVAVLYPVRSMWAAIDPNQTETARRIEADFDAISRCLLRVHRDFDYISEEIFQEAEVTHGQLVVGKPGQTPYEKFKALVLPRCSVLDKKTVEKIREFVDTGGTLIITGTLPHILREVGETSRVTREFESFLEKRARLIDLGTPENAGACQIMEEALSGIQRDLSVHDVHGREVAEIVGYHYVKGDEDIYLLVNTSLETAYDVTLRFGSTGEVYSWDGETDEYSLLEGVRDKCMTTLTGHFAPGQSRVFVIVPERRYGSRASSKKPACPKKVIKLSGPFSFVPERANVLPLTRWTFHWEVEGDSDGFRTQMGIFEHEFAVKGTIANMGLILDGIDPILLQGEGRQKAHIFVNEHLLTSFEKDNYLDQEALFVSLGGLIQEGSNSIKIVFSGFLAELPSLHQPVFLIGDFIITEHHELLAYEHSLTLPDGVWTKHGFPYYSGTALLEVMWELPEDVLAFEEALLRFETVGDMVEVSVNGNYVGALLWEPFEIDITDYIEPGENLLQLKVTNSLCNMLEAKNIDSGLTGDVLLVLR